MKTYGGRDVKTQIFPDFGNSWSCSVSFKLRPLCPVEKPLVLNEQEIAWVPEPPLTIIRK
jgi:hypothetical protein